MALTQLTMATASFKKVLGIAHTDNAKNPGNEAYRTGFSVSGSTVFGADVPGVPSKSALYDITGGVVEFVRLQLIADPTSNGHAFFAALPANYQTSTSNFKKSLSYFANNSKLADSAGKIQIIPSSFGALYEAIPSYGGTASKGTGTVISPVDARDWNLDVYNGIFYQQGSGGSDPAPTYVECFIWVGGYVTDQLADIISSIGSGASTFIANSTLINAVDDYYLVDTQVPNLTSHSASKWYITAYYGTRVHVTEVTAILVNGQAAYNEYGRVHVGNPLIQVKAMASGGNLVLLAKPSIAGVTLDVKRLAVI
jgi:hypothetical protein